MVERIVVPSPTEAYYRSWIKEISTFLEAGKDVEFFDSLGNPTQIDFVQVNADGLVNYLSYGMTTPVKSFFVKGGFLKITGISKIYSTDTDNGLALKVKASND